MYQQQHQQHNEFEPFDELDQSQISMTEQETNFPDVFGSSRNQTGNDLLSMMYPAANSTSN